MPVVPHASLTAQALDAKFARKQRHYSSRYSVAYVHQPPPPPRPEPQNAASPFPAWRAAASELGLQGGGDPSNPAARGDDVMPGVAAAPRRKLHDVLLGTSAVVLLGVVGGIGYVVWSGALPGMAALPGGAAPKGSSLAAVVQPFMNLAAKAAPDRTAVSQPAQDVAPDAPASRPASQPTAPLPLPSPAPTPLVLATPLADKPALAGPPPLPAPLPSAVAKEAAPAPERVAAGPAPLAKPSEPDAAAPKPAVPAAPAEAVPVPSPERATAAAVPLAKVPEPDTTLPVPAAERAAAKAVPPVRASDPDAALSVPAVAAMTVRLPPAPEWTTAPPAALAGLSEAAPPPLAPLAAPASSVPPAAAAASEEAAAKAVPPGVDAQRVVSTMTLVQQMSLLVHDMHDEGLRYRLEVSALTGAVQAKASNLEERLKLAEARSAAGSDAGGPQPGAPASAVALGGSPVLRGYRVQAGSPGAAVLTDVGGGPERAARLLVMVGDQLPGAGRVMGIEQRGRGWIVRTERGLIQ